ncbi:NUDIX domain-containing protein [Catellatospora coxensis]
MSPLDAVERGHQIDILGWIDAGYDLFRVNPPADPPKHLAVYFALFDDDEGTVMMVDHKKAAAWLLPGGHVDPYEDPRVTALREAEEELQIAGKFHDLTGDAPLFVSVTETRGAHSHTDVTLWFVLKASQRELFRPDPGEFEAVEWFPCGAPTGTGTGSTQTWRGLSGSSISWRRSNLGAGRKRIVLRS